MTKEDILKKCVVTEGNVVKLPFISKYHNIDKYYSIPNVYKALLSGLSKYLPS